ncbi:hemicentin-2 [Platysternon megacephalum]|uniref:Hemicentin-2 n=1 Tax=Platysternon megacephalum TaxID=55544 RepID=A0A4D9DQT3_9SAUR|nr:hemicentin-2 [Platysternon megacephalum]
MERGGGAQEEIRSGMQAGAASCSLRGEDEGPSSAKHSSMCLSPNKINAEMGQTAGSDARGTILLQEDTGMGIWEAGGIVGAESKEDGQHGLKGCEVGSKEAGGQQGAVVTLRHGQSMGQRAVGKKRTCCKRKNCWELGTARMG